MKTKLLLATMFFLLSCVPAIGAEHKQPDDGDMFLYLRQDALEHRQEELQKQLDVLQSLMATLPIGALQSQIDSLQSHRRLPLFVLEHSAKMNVDIAEENVKRAEENVARAEQNLLLANRLVGFSAICVLLASCALIFCARSYFAERKELSNKDSEK